MERSSLFLDRAQTPFEFGSRQAYANSNDKPWSRVAGSRRSDRANAPGRVLLEIGLVLAAAFTLVLAVTMFVPAS